MGEDRIYSQAPSRFPINTGYVEGWAQEEAVQYMLEHTAASEDNIRNEVTRYITWPGQATAYKIGQLKIEELRKRAFEELGENFNIKDFHDVVLRSVGPLDMLEEQ